MSAFWEEIPASIADTVQTNGATDATPAWSTLLKPGSIALIATAVVLTVWKIFAPHAANFVTNVHQADGAITAACALTVLLK